ncbi:MAG: beta-lactam-binding protein with PASTA domain, partial [Arenicella sp.]
KNLIIVVFKKSRVMELFNSDSQRSLIINILSILLLFLVSILLFFKLYLPFATNFGETVTVPDFQGLDLESASELSDRRDLTYTVVDSVYSNDFPPNHIVTQFPLPNSKVKVSRKVHFVINVNTATTAVIPNVIGSSLGNAQQQLRSFGFKIGKVNYVPHATSNEVLGISLGGVQLSESDLEGNVVAKKNQPIDITVADGIGKIDLKMPQLIGKPLDEAEVFLLGLNLRIRKIHWRSSQKAYGTVLNQKPLRNAKIRVNQSVDVWVASE